MNLKQEITKLRSDIEDVKLNVRNNNILLNRIIDRLDNNQEKDELFRDVANMLQYLKVYSQKNEEHIRDLESRVIYKKQVWSKMQNEKD
jgi:hypothetical protein